MDTILSEAQNKIQSAIEHLKIELSAIRAGRANPSLVENLPVNAYGSQMKLMEVGTISAPQPSLITVQIWDASIIPSVQKSILESKLGINPSIEGNMIRLPIPPLTEERRQEFVRLSHNKGEECKITVRQIRAEEREKWESEKKSGEIGEDEFFRREKLLQDLIDKTVTSIEELVKKKTEDLTQI